MTGVILQVGMADFLPVLHGVRGNLAHIGNMMQRSFLERMGASACRVLGIFLFLLAVAGLCPGAVSVQAGESVAKDAKLGGDAQRTRFVTVLSKKVRFGIRTLADPYRVIVDLSDVRLDLPKGRGEEAHGLVKGYRYGRVEPFGVRIILDVDGPVRVEKASIWEQSGDNPPRLVVDLVKSTRKAFLEKQRKELASIRREHKREQAREQKHLPVPKRRNDAKKVIVIDPGHGGIDPGAVSKSGLEEKEIVFEFSQQLAKHLRKEGRYEVVMTRTVDTYIPLRKRVDIARDIAADLFISIHADALPGRYADSVSGATVYTLSEDASDDEAKELAAKENKSDIIAGVALPPEADDVANILIDLAQRETKNLSISFAGTLIDSLNGTTKLTKKYRKFAGFRVLKAPDVPSVLLELGYMTNASDVRRLQSQAWRIKVAKAISRSIDAYFAKKTAHNPY